MNTNKNIEREIWRAKLQEELRIEEMRSRRSSPTLWDYIFFGSFIVFCAVTIWVVITGGIK